MLAPSDDTNHCSSRLKLRLVSARVMPATAHSSESTLRSRAMLSPTDIVNGSMAYGVVHSAVTGFSGARRTSCCFTCADARAISTARAAIASTPDCDRFSVAANPHEPSAITRTLILADYESDALPTLPFFVVSARLLWLT